jgi:hypothetical protein
MRKTPLQAQELIRPTIAPGPLADLALYSEAYSRFVLIGWPVGVEYPVDAKALLPRSSEKKITAWTAFQIMQAFCAGSTYRGKRYLMRFRSNQWGKCLSLFIISAIFTFRFITEEDQVEGLKDGFVVLNPASEVLVACSVSEKWQIKAHAALRPPSSREYHLLSHSAYFVTTLVGFHSNTQLLHKRGEYLPSNVNPVILIETIVLQKNMRKIICWM